MFGLSKKDLTYIVVAAIVGFMLNDLYNAMKAKAGLPPSQ
jgi:hypothetical protein